MGDVIEREVTLDIKAPYKLIETSLPIPGYEKRYRGQVLGIELKAIAHTKDVHDAFERHHIKLTYQNFTKTVVAKNVALGPEYLNLIHTKNNKDIVKYRIPTFNVNISPLAIFGQVKVENNMSPFLEPLLMPDAQEKKWLNVALVVLIISLLGLLYILGQHAWLPRMGGNFAKAYRAIKKLPDTPEGLKSSISSVHQALNQTAGVAIFSDNIQTLLDQQPNFNAVKPELNQFFALSRQVYFEPNADHGLGKHPVKWLLNFTRRCRDCERGLIPSAQKIEG
jgi:mxaA protein